jgi:N-acyl-D-aspartate/D-glutamate deacylase
MRGLALAPGFIDAHTHDDRIVLDAPDMLAKISQGVTSVVVGNCGISLAPVTFSDAPPPPMNLLGGAEAYAFPSFAAYAEAIARTAPGVTVAAPIGHSALRLATMADIGSKASLSEIEAMQAHADEAMAHGAIGLSRVAVGSHERNSIHQSDWKKLATKDVPGMLASAIREREKRRPEMNSRASAVDGRASRPSNPSGACTSGGCCGTHRRPSHDVRSTPRQNRRRRHDPGGASSGRGSPRRPWRFHPDQ